MKRDTGTRDFPIWLLVDSEPAVQNDVFKYPFGYHHHVRQNIWTPILNLIQEKLYEYDKEYRIDSERIYLRNTVADPSIKPKASQVNWTNQPGLQKEIDGYRRLINSHKPKLILPVGSFAFEFLRRCLSETPRRPYKYWTSQLLVSEFGKRFVMDNGITKTRVLPLLHRTIADERVDRANYKAASIKQQNEMPDYLENVAELIMLAIREYENIYLPR